MTLTDASSLVALTNKNDPANTQCRAAVKTLKKPLITTWVCFTEAMHLAHRDGGWFLQSQLWQYPRQGILLFHLPTPGEDERMFQLMKQYHHPGRPDRSMDLGDASLVAAAEVLGLTRIFTLDNDFRIYRINGITPFDVVP
jgi:predicted nucleic acid-binding protein